jgi:hypothetical protein
MTLPLALAKVIVPVQDGAIAPAVLSVDVLLSTLIWAVSELASPTGGKL